MFTVTSIFTSDYRIKSSKFLGFLCSAATIHDAEEHLQDIRKQHPTATHHCYAYLINPAKQTEFSSDDGEPGGTAGLPILHTLKSHDLMNVILVVVRYYGGTKLGKSGLIDAYGEVANQAIHNAALKKLIPIKTYQLEYDYSKQSLIDKWKNSFSWTELDASYLESISLMIGCPLSESHLFEKTVASQKHQLIEFEHLGESFHINN